jgi:hypothetical protein
MDGNWKDHADTVGLYRADHVSDSTSQPIRIDLALCTYAQRLRRSCRCDRDCNFNRSARPSLPPGQSLLNPLDRIRIVRGDPAVKQLLSA